MKVISKINLRLLSLSLTAIFMLILLAPAPAQARGEKFLFAYPKDAADEIKADVEDNKKSNEVMSRSSVWVKDGLFKDTQFKLPFSSSRQNGNEREYVYAQTYDCTNSGLVQGSVVPRDGLKFYKVTLAARVKLDTSFNSKSPSGFAAVPELIIKEGTNETKYGSGGRAVNLNDLPAACRPTNGAITLQNYQRLNDSQKAEWSSAKSDVERSEAAAAADPSSGGGGGVDDNACASNESAGAFAWVLCPAISVITSTVKSIQDEVIVPNLKVAPLDPNDGYGQSLYQIWNNIRSVANAAFVLIFLYIIFANTLSINVNAYTIKKMLPRLVAAAILVQFSFIITALAIDIGNILGTGIAGLVDFSVGGTDATGSGTSFSEVARSVIVLGASAVAVISLVGVPTIVIVLLGALIALMGVVFTLVARKLIIAVLVVTSAPAFVAWVLPKTEKFFTTWLTTLIKIILMYPLIVLLLKLSTVLAGVTSSSGSDFEILLAAMFPIIAWFMVPMTFSWGGKTMNMAAGQIGNVTGKTKSFAQGTVKNSRPVKSYEANKAIRTNSKIGNRLGGTGVVGGAKKWWSQTQLTGAPLGGRLTSDGGWFKESPAVQQQLSGAQQELWRNAQKSMDGLSPDSLNARINGKNATQAVAAAGALAADGMLKTSHLSDLRKMHKGNEKEGIRAFGFAQNQIKDKAANPVLARAEWNEIGEDGKVTVGEGTRNKIVQATTPKALGSIKMDGIKALEDAKTESGRSLISDIKTETIESALGNKTIKNGMSQEVQDRLQSIVDSRKGGGTTSGGSGAGTGGATVPHPTGSSPTSGRGTTTGGAAPTVGPSII